MRCRLHKLVFGTVGMTQIEQIDDGPIEFDADLQAQYIRGSLTFTRLNESIMLNGTLETEISVQCVRSLEFFPLAQTVELDTILFALPGQTLEYVDAAEDIRPGIHDDFWLDLTETVREEILMAIPINPVSPKFAGLAAGALPDGFDANDSEWLSVRWRSAPDDGKRGEE